MEVCTTQIPDVVGSVTDTFSVSCFFSLLQFWNTQCYYHGSEIVCLPNMKASRLKYIRNYCMDYLEIPADPLTFPPVPPADQRFNLHSENSLNIIEIDCHKIWYRCSQTLYPYGRPPCSWYALSCKDAFLVQKQINLLLSHSTSLAPPDQFASANGSGTSQFIFNFQGSLSMVAKGLWTQLDRLAMKRVMKCINKCWTIVYSHWRKNIPSSLFDIVTIEDLTALRTSWLLTIVGHIKPCLILR